MNSVWLFSSRIVIAPNSAVLVVITAAGVTANALPASEDNAITPGGPQSQNSGESTSAPNGAPELGEIVVTAEKREQRANDVGLSIVAVTGPQLVAAGVDDITQLYKVSPGLFIAHGEFGYPFFSLRGVNLNTGTLSTIPAVSTYVDEALLPYPVTAQGALLDVEHVEVLKGPQGTLFGQNATGGAINIVAAKLTNYFTSGMQIEYNDFGGLRRVYRAAAHRGNNRII
jgi:iron complex outermembrane receptor protein